MCRCWKSRKAAIIAESNAILWYVANGTSLSPESRIERAEALQWMFFEQHALEPNIGAAYFWLALVRGGRDLQTHALEDWMERGYAALQVMENHLKIHDLLCRQPAHRRRHRALWLHPCRRPLRLRSLDLPRDPRLAQARRAVPALRDHGLARRRDRRPGEHRGGRVIGRIYDALRSTSPLRGERRTLPDAVAVRPQSLTTINACGESGAELPQYCRPEKPRFPQHGG